MDSEELRLRVRAALSEKDHVLVDSLMEQHTTVAGVEELSIWVRSLYLNGSFEKCLEKCENLKKEDGGNFSATIFTARALSSIGRSDESIEEYRKMLVTYPSEREPLVMMIRHHYIKTENFKRAMQLIETLLDLDPRNEQGLLFRARILQRERSSLEALEAYKELHERFPENLEANGRIGQISYEIEEYLQAKKFLLSALEIDENYRPARRLIGLCIERLGETSEALGYLLAEAEREPEIMSNWEKVIDLYLKMNKEEKARDVVESAYLKIDDQILAIVTKYYLSRSIFWEEGYESAINELDEKFGDDFEAHRMMFEVTMETGEISKSAYAISRMENSKVSFSEEKLNQCKDAINSVLYKVDSNIQDVIEGDKLISELAIMKIVKESNTELRRKASTKKHRIVQISSSLGRGGAERQLSIGVSGIAERKGSVGSISVMTYEPSDESKTYASDIRKSGVEIIHYGSSLGWESEFSDDGLDRYAEVIKLLPDRFQRDLIPLSRALIKSRPTIVHTWQDETNIIAGLASLIARVPVIIMFGRSMRPDGKTMLHIRNRPYLKKAYSAILGSRDVHLCLNSNEGRRSYAEWLGMDDSKLWYIPNGIDFESFISVGNKQEVEEFFEKEEIGNDHSIVGGVFRFVKEKRLELWIKSAMEVIDKRQNVTFIAVGDGPERSVAIELVKDTIYEKRILFPGSTTSVVSWLERFDLFLLTSSVEGLPNVLIEAQAVGVPVLSTQAGGSSDTFSNLETGVILEDESPKSIAGRVMLCLDDFSWRTRAGERGRLRTREEFSLDALTDNLESLYNEVSKDAAREWSKDAGMMLKIRALVGKE